MFVQKGLNMNKRLVFYCVVIVFFVALVIFMGVRIFSSKNVVKVCGKVFYNDYKGGDIFVFWRKDLRLGFPRPENSPVLVRNVPGEYCVYVPKSVGDFYISAKCAIVDGSIKNQSDAYFVSDLIMVEPGKDLIKLNVYLKKKKKLMDYYSGPTIKISGKIVQKDYAGGLFAVTVQTLENQKKVYLPPDINHKYISSPGSYSIDVPANIGKVYINALNYPSSDLNTVVGDMPGVIFSSNKNNPIEIGAFDITNFDIEIPKRTKL